MKEFMTHTSGIHNRLLIGSWGKQMHEWSINTLNWDDPQCNDETSVGERTKEWTGTREEAGAERWLSADRDRKRRKKLWTYTCQRGSSIKTLHKSEKPTWPFLKYTHRAECDEPETLMSLKWRQTIHATHFMLHIAVGKEFCFASNGHIVMLVRRDFCSFSV